MTRRFTARTAGIEVPDIGEIPPYWIRVVVHDADHQMRRAYAKHSGGSIRNVADVGGRIHPRRQGWAQRIPRHPPLLSRVAAHRVHRPRIHPRRRVPRTDLLR